MKGEKWGDKRGKRREERESEDGVVGVGVRGGG